MGFKSVRLILFQMYLKRAIYIFFRGNVTIVRLGDLDHSTTNDNMTHVNLNISELIFFPNFTSGQKYFDIGLIKLDQNVVFTKNIRPACLPMVDIDDESGQSLIATGWGSKAALEDISPYLQMVDLHIISNENCSEVFSENFLGMPDGLNEISQFCAGNGEKDTCNGDSGGPLQSNHSLPCMYTIVGVTSAGQGCGLQDVPGLYTNVFAFVHWIEEIVWNKVFY